MATLYAAADGTILRFLQTHDEEASWGAPDGAPHVLSFDEATNADIVDGLNTDWNSHSLPGGVLHRHGAPLAFAAPSQRYLARQNLAAAKATLATYHATTRSTAAQTAEAMHALIDVMWALIEEAN